MFESMLKVTKTPKGVDPIPTPEQLGKITYAAMRKEAFKLRGRMKEGIESGRPGGKRLTPLSQIRRERRLDRMRGKQRLKSGKFGKLRKLRGGYSKFKKRRHPLGKLANAMYVKKYDARREVAIGWVTTSARMFADAVQEGKSGLRYLFQYDGDQIVTPRMRRFFAAAGVYLPKGYKLRRHERPAMDQLEKTENPRAIQAIEQDTFERLDRRLNKR